MQTKVPRVKDFIVTGTGRATTWNEAEWMPLSRVGAGKLKYASRIKLLYSATGLYCLFDNEDRKLGCTMTEDFDDIYKEDVVEAFFWPDTKHPLYFEYELSPLNVELPILIPNYNGSFMGWRPWHYENERMTRHATSVRGGKKAPMARIKGWVAEFFIPFKLMSGMGNVPPHHGTQWRANFYRIDYDAGKPTQWAWCARTDIHFHDFQKFGTIIFE